MQNQEKNKKIQQFYPTNEEEEDLEGIMEHITSLLDQG